MGYAPTGTGGGFHWQAYFHQYQNLRPGTVLPTPPKPNVSPAANAGGGATYPQSQGGTGGGGSAGGNDVGFFEGLFGFGKSVVNSIQDGLASLIRIPLDMAYGNFSAELDISRARREWATEQLANPNGDWGAAINAYQHPLQGMDATINLLTETMLATAGNIGNVGLAERVFVGGMAREVTASPAMAGFFWFMRKKALGGLPVPDAGDLSKLGAAPGKGGLSKAGHSLSKHGAGKRQGSSAFPDPIGSPAQINQQAQKVLDDILNDPARDVKQRPGRPGETLLQIHRPDGSGVIFKWDGTGWQFSHFAENLY